MMWRLFGCCGRSAYEQIMQQGTSLDDDLRNKNKKPPPPPAVSMTFFDATERHDKEEDFSGTAGDDTTSDDSDAFAWFREEFSHRNDDGTVFLDALTTLNDGNDLQTNKAIRKKNQFGFDPSTQDLRTILMQHNNESDEGYPGSLSDDQIHACQELRQRLKEHQDERYKSMVMALSDMEDEEFALCRFLRACDFQVDQVFDLVDEFLDPWAEASEHGFYPTCEDAVGQTEDVFSFQLPILYSGLSKNGAVVSYLKLGKCELDGLETLVDFGDLEKYWWYRMMHQFPKQVKQLRSDNNKTPVRCEEFYVIDMAGLSYKQVSRRAISVLQKMFTPTGCFPEIQNKALILNAPAFFRMIWGIAKNCIYERTANKVEVFNDNGEERLRELLEADGIPKDYGGDAPWICEIRQNQFCESGHRQAYQLFDPRSEINFTFDLTDGEVAEVLILTRSENKVLAKVHKDDHVVYEAEVGHGEVKPKAFKIGSNLEGPGSYILTLEKDAKAYFSAIANIATNRKEKVDRDNI
jgi:CRAL/TRIO domain